MQAKVKILEPQLDQVQQKLEGLDFDEVLVQRADDITQLHEQRIKIRDGKDHLPKRRAELEYELGELARLATELGWETAEPAELIDRIPARGKVARLHALGMQRGELATVVQEANKGCRGGSDLTECEDGAAGRDGRSSRRIKAGCSIECRARQR